MSTEEVKNWLLQNFPKEDPYFGSHNERFRKQLYDIYLGGLDAEKFLLLFKRVEQARTILQNRLYQETGKSVRVEILADLLDIRDDSWRNAVEGYLGSNKLLLVVESRYARTAMEIYRELDKEKYYQVAVLDTGRVMGDEHKVLDHALSEEVETSRDYVRAYIEKIIEAQKPQQEIIAETRRILELEELAQEKSVYLEWKRDMEALPAQRKEQQKLRDKLEQLRSQNVDQMEEERRALQTLRDRQIQVQKEQQRIADKLSVEAKRERENLLSLNEDLLEKKGR